ncbi:MAG: hypothetical protein M1820_000414 [Bogoriella megaspora]|nr:MAG: hypothetical protein M1820_000414 [Bogoriella megaspora]
MKRSNSKDGGVSPPSLKRKFKSATTSTAVASFFTPISKKQPEKLSWRIVNQTLLVGQHGELIQPATTAVKIAAFDFDSTLITTASGRKYAKEPSDWKWWDASVPETLKKLAEEGYLIVILSNQSGINLTSESGKPQADRKRLSDFKTKASAVLNQLGFPITLYAATTQDIYRKPRTGMWSQLINDYNLQAADAIDLYNSMFVGDAAGRAVGSSANGGKDFSCSDRNFATNVGIPFQTPEEFFLKEEVKPFTRDFDPTKYVGPNATVSIDATPLLFSKTNILDIVIFCGSPGAGKSTFYWKHLQPLGYERVNQDIFKTRDKCLKVAENYLKEGKSVAVDNTNADVDTRAEWIKLSRRMDVPIRCVHFTANAKLCEHNDVVRALNGSLMNPENRQILPKMAFSSFVSRYREPTLKEGFEDIVRAEFTFEGTDEQKKVWLQYWL